MKRLFAYIVLIVCFSTCSFAQERLVFSIDLIRHGDRTPLIPSPGMEKVWPQGLQQLTPQGMHQSYKLGQHLRQQYVTRLKLLPSQYDINTMAVRASNTARTMMTAQSILYGLYPLGTGPSLSQSAKALPQGLQPIPINTVPRALDSLLVPNHDPAKAEQFLKTYIFSHPDWISRDASLRPKYAQWSKMFGVPITRLFDLIAISDRLYVESIYGVSRPAGLNEKDAKLIIQSGRWAWLSIVNHPTLALEAGHELARTIKQELCASANQERALKYLLFVAHDSTLSAQLRLLGNIVKEMPPYVAELNYSLFDLGSANYEVRITYNQKPLYIEQCGTKHCTLDEFVDFMDNQLQA